MKYFLKPMLFIFVSMFVFTSCNNEDLFIEETLLADIEETPTDLEDSPNDSDTTVDSSMPCDFTLESLQAGDTVIINCIMDLGAATINLPANVTIVFDGGDIINGTLNFSNNSVISGDLLNSSLNITGSTPQLKDTTFNFDPNRWGIIEGVVSDDVAYDNKLIINQIMEDVKAFGVTTIKIDYLDAYFQTQPGFRLSHSETPHESAIRVPSNIHLIMTDNTHLRTQPNNFYNTVLITMFRADNSIVEGGFLHGDRDTHDYSAWSSHSSHEWGHLVLLKASKNIVLKNTTLIDAGGDGITINAKSHAFKSSYTYCENLTISGNKIIRARRNGISITDGRNIVIENNEIIDSGVDTALSDGTNPRWAIDIEPVWSGGVKYEIVENVIIRNNIESGSEKGGFINARGSYITYEDNAMENAIAMGQTIGSIVRNNTFANHGNSRTAIYAGDGENEYGNERNHSNEVYGNTINGFNLGIKLQDPGVDLNNNIITNCGSGIQIKNSRDSKIRNNTISNEVSQSEGIGNNSPTDYINNVDIYNNFIKVKGSPFRFTNVNLADANIGFSITIRDNDVTSIDNTNSSFSKIRGFNFENNICHNSGIRTVNSSVGGISNNLFENGVIRISGGCVDLNFIDNTITGGRCFQDDNTDAINIIKQNNICN